VPGARGKPLTFETMRPVDAACFAGVRLVQVSAGLVHSLAVDAEGNCYSCGDHAHLVGIPSSAPGRLPFTPSAGKAVTCAAGMNHSFIVEHDLPSGVEDGAAREPGGEAPIVPWDARTVAGASPASVVDAAEGPRAAGRPGPDDLPPPGPVGLWAFGLGAQGQLGLGHWEPVREPTRVSHPGLDPTSG